ncbi:MAG: hypothetical protein ACRDVE_19155 [Actinocrinis sp.]
MAELPAHPDTEPRGADDEPAFAGVSRRRTMLGIAIAVVLVVLFVVLHLTGVVGAEGH